MACVAGGVVFDGFDQLPLPLGGDDGSGPVLVVGQRLVGPYGGVGGDAGGGVELGPEDLVAVVAVEHVDASQLVGVPAGSEGVLKPGREQRAVLVDVGEPRGPHERRVGGDGGDLLVQPRHQMAGVCAMPPPWRASQSLMSMMPDRAGSRWPVGSVRAGRVRARRSLLVHCGW